MRAAMIARLSTLFFLLASNLCLAAAAPGAEWTVAEVAGTVSATARDAASTPLPVRKDVHLAAPFTVQTGADGHLVLVRDEDRVTAGGNARFEVEPPAPKGEGAVTTRFDQTQGSLLYHVQRRPPNGFEVQTPYLVSVVKGTTFNVLAAADATTVSLIEGRLLLTAPDRHLEQFLEAGQAGIRSKGSDRIIVKDQQALSPPVRGPITIVHDNAHSTVVEISPDGSIAPVIASEASGGGASGTIAAGPRNSLPGNAAAVGLAGTAVSVATTGGTTSVATSVELGHSSLVSVGTGANVGLGGETTSLASSTSVSLGGASAAAGTTVSLGSGGASLTSGISAGLGSVTVDSGTSLGVGGSGVSLGSVAAANVGSVSVDTGTSVGLGSGSLGVGNTTSIGTGSGSLTAGLSAGAGTSGVTAGAGLTTTGTAPLNVSANLNASGGNVAIDTSLGSGTLNANVNAGQALTTVGNTASGAVSTVTNIVNKTGLLPKL